MGNQGAAGRLAVADIGEDSTAIGPALERIGVPDWLLGAPGNELADTQALNACDQPGHVLPGPPARLRTREPAPDPSVRLIQLRRPYRHIDIRHTRHNEAIIDTSRLASAVAVLGR